jgi:hypothetical protein
VVRELEGKGLDMFSRSKDFVEQNSVETIDTGVDQSIKDHLVNLQSRFCKYIKEGISDKYVWIRDQFHDDSPQYYEFLLKKKETTLALYPINFIDCILLCIKY